MLSWTEPALRAEIAYRQETVRRDFARCRRRRPPAPLPVRPVPVVEIPAQRTAGPGEQRVPVGAASVPERR